jgi:hypothetical protein
VEILDSSQATLLCIEIKFFIKLYLFINDLCNHAVCYFGAVTSNGWIRVIVASGKKDDLFLTKLKIAAWHLCEGVEKLMT